MKNIFAKIQLLIFISSLLIANGYAQEINKIKGTIGNEKMGSDKIVICVYGTAACMPVNIDSNMTVKFKGKETKLTELPFGLYLETDIVRDKNGTTVKNIMIDENRTVLCFRELGKEKEKKLSEVFNKIDKVKSFHINSESNQAYIEFDSKAIAYKDLESAIQKAGFELE